MTQNKITIASLNLCLGLKNKKEEVKRLIIENEIDILCVQETEIQLDYPINWLTFSGYNYESESNNLKARCGIYVANSISYVRRHEMETKNIHVMIIDLNDQLNTRIINLYRTFNLVSFYEYYKQTWIQISIYQCCGSGPFFRIRIRGSGF